MNAVKIIPFKKKFQRVFKQLNMEWLEGYGLLEPADLKYLDNPFKTIIDPGGKIFLAVINDKVIGTCAIIVKDQKTFELAKLAVSKEARRKGVGKSLTLESIKQAKDLGAEMMNLVSNKKLSSAIGLYESLGFEHAAIPVDMDYETADVYMELKII